MLADPRTTRPAIYQYVSQTLGLATPIVSNVDGTATRELHQTIARAVGAHQRYVKPLMTQHEHIFWEVLFDSDRKCGSDRNISDTPSINEMGQYMYNLHVQPNLAWSVYLWWVWIQWCFGEQVCAVTCRNVYQTVQTCMKTRIFENRRAHVWLCQKKPSMSARICRGRAQYLVQSGQGWVGAVYKQNPDLGIDCAILSMLAYDFVLATGQCVISNPKSPDIMDSIVPAYFYPVRWRWNGWSLVSLDLVKSRCYFSYGSQSCIGPNILRILFDHL
jgi:hypothetical protein